MAAPIFEHLDPADGPLLQLVRQHVDDLMLREIAEADYGFDVDGHLKALKEIKAGAIPAPMQWEPREVLELIRWSEPEDPNWSPGSTGERGHWMRLFVCAILLRAAAEPENDGYFDGDDSTIIQLVDSAMKLGNEISIAALQFLCWRMDHRTLTEWDRPYFAIAILMLAVSLDKSTQPMEDDLIVVAINDETALSRLFRMSMMSKSWKALARSLLTKPSQPSSNVTDFLKGLLGDGWMAS